MKIENAQLPRNERVGRLRQSRSRRQIATRPSLLLTLNQGAIRMVGIAIQKVGIAIQKVKLGLDQRRGRREPQKKRKVGNPVVVLLGSVKREQQHRRGKSPEAIGSEAREMIEAARKIDRERHDDPQEVANEEGK
jgi:hypothetical protein